MTKSRLERELHELRNEVLSLKKKHLELEKMCQNTSTATGNTITCGNCVTYDKDLDVNLQRNLNMPRPSDSNCIKQAGASCRVNFGYDVNGNVTGILQNNGWLSVPSIDVENLEVGDDGINTDSVGGVLKIKGNLTVTGTTTGDGGFTTQSGNFTTTDGGFTTTDGGFTTTSGTFTTTTGNFHNLEGGQLVMNHSMKQGTSSEIGTWGGGMIYSQDNNFCWADTGGGDTCIALTNDSSES